MHEKEVRVSGDIAICPGFKSHSHLESGVPPMTKLKPLYLDLQFG